MCHVKAVNISECEIDFNKCITRHETNTPNKISGASNIRIILASKNASSIYAYLSIFLECVRPLCNLSTRARLQTVIVSSFHIIQPGASPCSSSPPCPAGSFVSLLYPLFQKNSRPTLFVFVSPIERGGSNLTREPYRPSERLLVKPKQTSLSHHYERCLLKESACELTCLLSPS